VDLPSIDGAVTADTAVNGHAPARARARRVLVAAGTAAGSPPTEDGVTEHVDRPSLPPYPDKGEPAPTEASFAAVAIRRDDDLAAIFGKIDAADSPRVALVAPRGNQLLSRQLGMRRLQRHLDLSGKDLILVTRSRVLRVRAREEGVPAVKHLRKVDFERRGRGGLQLGWVTLRLPTLGALLAVGVFVLSMVLGALVLFWYVPTATVTVFVPAQTIGDTIDLVVDPRASEVNVAKGIVPGRRREITIRRTIPGPATGIRSEGVEHAGLGLVFTNKTNRPVVVTKGTVVTAANGMPFTVANDINLTGRVGATGEAIALAQRPGTAGNIPPNTATRLDPALADAVSVNNPAPGEKGTDFTQTVVSENDVLFITNLAKAYLADAAKKEFLAQYADSETVFGDSARVDIIDSTPIPAINQVARYTEVSYTAKVSMLTAADEDLRKIYVDRFRAKAGSDKMLLDDYFKVAGERAGTLDTTFDRLTVSPRVTVPVAPLIDRAELREALAGRSRSAVERVVRERVDSDVPPVVEMPGWALWLPKKANRMTLVLKPAP
jgi:hypothetical protein